MPRRFTVQVSLIAVAASLLLLLTTSYARQLNVWDSLDLLVDVRHQLIAEYVEQPDERTMVEAAVRGMIDSLNDPFTSFLAPEDLEQFDRLTTGSFSGIGAEITIDDGQLKITTPLEDSPAWNAGVLAGDIVIEIGDKPVLEIFEGKRSDGEKLRAAVDQLTGEAGTDVTIRVRHETGEEERITITRDVINIQTVRGFRREHDQHFDFMLDDERHIGYVRLTQFTERTPEELAEALKQLIDRGMAGLIIDVRFNPGGLLQSAVAISDMFLPDGYPIVSVKGRTVPEQVHRATENALLPDLPIVILANEASASASEILAGALVDNDRALFVGTRTFGKGSVQQVKMLGDATEPLGALKITNAYYYLPSGRLIHRRAEQEEAAEEGEVGTWGVDPSPGCYVRMTPEQVRDMIEVRREGDVVRPTNGDADNGSITPQWVDQHLKDPQLAAALEAMIAKLTSGQWPQVGGSNVEALLLASKRDNLVARRELLQTRLEEIEQELAELEQSGEAPAADDAAEAELDAETPNEPAPRTEGPDSTEATAPAETEAPDAAERDEPAEQEAQEAPAELVPSP